MCCVSHDDGKEVLISEIEKAISDMITSEMSKALDDTGVEVIHN